MSTVHLPTGPEPLGGRHGRANGARFRARLEIGLPAALDTLADQIDPDTVELEADITEAELAREALSCVGAREWPTPGLSNAELDALPPLYTWEAELGEWRCALGAYTATQARAWIRREVARCARSLSYWATHYACTRNEHSEDEGLPTAELMPDWPFIVAFFDAVADPDNVLVEKSRDMMASWMSMATVTHDVLFRKDWSTMTMSRIEALVDNGGEASTVDSLHGKIRYIHEHQPPFLRFPLTFKYLQVRNDITRATVQGFSTTISAGRGPKYRRAVCDEWAWVPNSEQVMTSLHRACPRGKLLVSTPCGKANNFFRVRELAHPIWPVRAPGTLRPGAWKRVTIHWSQHPHRGQDWYDNECQSGSMTPEAIAQELDISYEQSLVGRVYPKFIYDVHVVGQPRCPLTHLPYDANRALTLCMDFNHDPLVWLIVQAYGDSHPPFRVLGQILRRNATFLDATWEFIVRYASHQRLARLFALHPEYEKVYGGGGVGIAGPDGHTMTVEIFGDSTEEKSTVYTRVRLYQQIKTLLEHEGGFTVVMHVPPANPPIADRIEISNDALGKGLVAIDPLAEELIKDYQSGVWDGTQKDMDQRKEDDDGSGLTRSHASSAFGYFLVQKHKVHTAGGARTRAKSQDIGKLVRRWRN